MAIAKAEQVRGLVDRAMARAKITDIHTHLYAPAFGDMLAWGVDELLTFHYLIAEFFRNTDLPYEAFWKMTKKEQADAIWKALFVDASPLSEATRAASSGSTLTSPSSTGFPPVVMVSFWSTTRTFSFARRSCTFDPVSSMR